MRSIGIVLASLVFTATVAAAESAPHRDRDLASQLSLAGLALPFLVVGAVVVTDPTPSRPTRDILAITVPVTAIFGPTVGHWYAGRTLTGGTVVRALGVGCAALGIAIASDGGPGGGMLAVGAGLVLVGGLYDAATADRAVDAWNRKHAVRVTPMVQPGGGTLGLGIAGAF